MDDSLVGRFMTLMAHPLPCYFINLARSHERRLRMLQRLAAQGLTGTRVEAIDARDTQQLEQRVRWSHEPSPVIGRAITPVEAAVTASHLLAIKQAYTDGAAHALIFEDDVTFDLRARWPSGWDGLMSSLPEQYGIAQLCVAALPYQLDALFSGHERYVKTDGITYASAAAYRIERRAMRVLLDTHLRGDRIDLTTMSVPSEMVLFGGALYRDASFVGPLLSRIPLFLYDGYDSEIGPDHNDFLRPSRDYVLTHYDVLVRNSYHSPFADRSTPTIRARIKAWVSARTPSKPTFMHPEALTGEHLTRVRIEQLAEYVDTVLPAQKRPFILLTDHAAHCRPAITSSMRDIILGHPLLRAWLSTHNNDHRIVSVPVGLAYDPSRPPGEQEREWQELRRRALPLRERLREPFWESDHDALLPWAQRMTRYGRHAVVVAPSHGFDCHEIWHALYMGCMVVMPSTAQLFLGSGLPVFSVDDIAALTTERVGSLLARCDPNHQQAVDQTLSLAMWQRYCRQKCRSHSIFRGPSDLSLSKT